MLKRRLLSLTATIALTLSAATAIKAEPGLRFGINAGIGLNSFSLRDYQSSLFDKSNFNCYWGGVMAEINTPLRSLFIDGALNFVHQTENSGEELRFNGCNYIQVPISVNYRLFLPLLGNAVVPYFGTGPEAAVVFDGDNRYDHSGFSFKNTSWSWNIGVGVELLESIKLGLRYGWRISDKNDILNLDHLKDVNNNHWSMSATIML